MPETHGQIAEIDGRSIPHVSAPAPVKLLFRPESSNCPQDFGLQAGLVRAQHGCSQPRQPELFERDAWPWAFIAAEDCRQWSREAGSA